MSFFPLGIFVQQAPVVMVADFPLNADTSYHTVCQITLDPGTYNLIGQMTLESAWTNSTGTTPFGRLFDGTNTLAVGGSYQEYTDISPATITLPSRVTVAIGGTTTIYLQARTQDSGNGDVVKSTLDSLTAGAATFLIATQIG